VAGAVGAVAGVVGVAVGTIGAAGQAAEAASIQVAVVAVSMSTEPVMSLTFFFCPLSLRTLRGFFTTSSGSPLADATLGTVAARFDSGPGLFSSDSKHLFVWPVAYQARRRQGVGQEALVPQISQVPWRQGREK